MKVAFIGLGVMGGPMAGHLARAGHDVAVCNRTRGKAEAWIARHGGRAADTPREAARDAEIVFSCVAGVIQGLAEGLAFALRAGLDAKRVIGAISKGAAASWQMENRGPTMVDGRFDFGFAVDLMRKDLRIAIEEARANGAELPVTALIDQFYAKLQQRGHGRLDTSSLMKLLSDR